MLSVPGAFRRIERAINESPPALFQKVGGEIAFYIRACIPDCWVARLDGARVTIAARDVRDPVLKIGMDSTRLSELALGTLDVEAALRDGAMGIGGHLGSPDALARCFRGPLGLVSLRCAAAAPKKTKLRRAS